MRYPLFLFALCMLLLSFDSCKKGCTNPHALNYNPSAKEDDASCLSCDSSLVDSQNQNNSVEDFTSGSPHYGDYVLEAATIANVYRYGGNACKQAGLMNVCGNGNPFAGLEYVDLVLTNNTSDTMLMSASVQIFNSGGGGQFDTVLTGITIAPYNYVTACKHVYLGCQSSSFFNTQVFFNSSTFHYR
jgi:hypothetical protein